MDTLTTDLGSKFDSTLGVADKEFYTSVDVIGDSLCYRGYDIASKKQVKRRFSFRPSLFLASEHGGDFKSLSGDSLRMIYAESPSHYRDMVKMYREAGVALFGNERHDVSYIGQEWLGKEVHYDRNLIRVAFLDIETECEAGFPDIESPTERVNVITLYLNKRYHIFCLGNAERMNLSDILKEDEDFEVHSFDEESELLKSFLELWNDSSFSPDIVSGWNIRFFDLPYLFYRIRALLGESEAKKLSPWRSVYKKNYAKWGQDYPIIEIAGISIVDYLETYRKYTFVTQESYKLDYIAEIELNVKKLDYSEYDGFKDFYTRNFPLFVKYNVQDVRLVQMLDEKLKLIDLHLYLTYHAKINVETAFSPVQFWDALVYNHLLAKGTVIPLKDAAEEKETAYAGAFVKDPIVGRHQWVVSFDLASLYPHLLIEHNIGPETIIDVENVPEEVKSVFYCADDTTRKVSIDDLLAKKVNTDILKKYDLSLTANLQFYRKDVRSFFSELMEWLYIERSASKKRSKALEKEAQEIRSKYTNSIPSEEMEKVRKLEVESKKFDIRQMALKICLNSAYGAIGNPYFRHYDTRNAEGITMSGQLMIRWIAQELNRFLNKTFPQPESEYDFVVAMDTDSCYLRLERVVETIFPNIAKQNGHYTPEDREKITKYLEKIGNSILNPFIEKKFAEIGEYLNSYAQKMMMKLEIISDVSVFFAKKRYCMNVLYSEGVDYTKKPKLKVMGLETQRSSTPKHARVALKECIRLILQGTENEFIEYVSSFKTKWMNELPVKDIAFPRGINGVEKYSDDTNIYGTKCPVAVRGALLFNHYVKQKRLTSKYPLIHDGSKGRFVYLKTPNPIREDVISFVEDIPKEFGLSSYVDRQRQWETAVESPLKNLTEPIKWNYERKNDISDLFA